MQKGSSVATFRVQCVCVCVGARAVLTTSSTSSQSKLCGCAGKRVAYLCRDPRGQHSEVMKLVATGLTVMVDYIEYRGGQK